MSYFEYVIGAYAVFAFFLAWDYLLPRIELQRTRRLIVQRAARDAARRSAAVPDAALPPPSMESKDTGA